MAKEISSRPKFVDEFLGYDPERDRQEVEQVGFLDLAMAYLSGVIPGDLPDVSSSFSGASDPRTLMDRSMDVFEHMRKVVYVQNCLKGLSAEQRKGAEKALSAAEAVRQVVGAPSESSAASGAAE